MAEVRHAANAPLLIVDDLGAEGAVTDWRQRVLLDLLEHRRGGATVVTSMLNIEDLAERYGDHITERLIELCRPVPMTGPGLRRSGRGDGAA